MNGSAPAPNFDPLKAAFEEVKPISEKEPSDALEKIFLVFHGAPETG